jgi:hypothetical protein
MSDIVETPKISSKHIPKSNLDKYNGFKVQSRTVKSTRFTNYIYEMIKEAKPELLSNDLVKIAFNDLIDSILKYKESITTNFPSKHLKYNKWNINDFNQLISNSWNYCFETDDAIIKIGSNEITDKFMILYDLIKRDVVPYMEIKQHEIRSKKTIESYINIIERLEIDIKKYEKIIKKYETKICDIRKTINEYAEKLIKLQQPTLTNFD